LGACLFLSVVAPAAPQGVGAHLDAGTSRPAERAAQSHPPLRLAEVLAPEPLLSLRPAVEAAGDQLDALTAWNRSRREPARIGFARPLPAPAVVRFGRSQLPARPVRHAPGILATSFAGALVWGTQVRVGGAYRLRLHLSQVDLPPSTRFWVWGLDGREKAFGIELLGPSGDLWTPSVGGDTVYFELEIPARALPRAADADAGETSPAFHFELPEVVESFRLDADGVPLPAATALAARPGAAFAAAAPGAAPQDSSCFVDASCIPAMAVYRAAVADLHFMIGPTAYQCTGALLADRASDGAPYLLSANHCFFTQDSVSSLEAFWDYHTASCNGAVPDLGSLPTSNGGTLLATGDSRTASDFSLIRLLSVPPNRAYLGWNPSAAAVPDGTLLVRVSHPGDLPQTYGETQVSATARSCPFLDRPDFLYSAPTRGGASFGSSGAPVGLAGGVTVGQVWGICNPADSSNGCDPSNLFVDGAFSATYPKIAPWVDRAAGSGSCAASATTLCIDNTPGDRRFQVQIDYATSEGGGRSGPGNAVPLSSLGVAEGGLFWFFDAGDPEVLVKILNACPLSSTFWVFFAATTNVGFTLTVTDTVTGHHKSYANPDRQAAAPVQDTAALSCP
jgi:hypothetical protein